MKKIHPLMNARIIDGQLYVLESGCRANIARVLKSKKLVLEALMAALTENDDPETALKVIRAILES